MPPNARVKIKGLYGLPKMRTPVTSIVLDTVAAFFKRHEGSALALTGAGVSVPSGIPDYRGTSGTYRIHGSYRPILHHELVSQHESRQRYWARSFFGIRPAFRADPNAIHYSFAKLEALGYLSGLITQNVDGLHSKAGSRNVLELHGTLKSVRCLNCGHEESRDVFQQRLERLNPEWVEFNNALASSDEKPVRRPDGDVDLPPNLSYEEFVYPTCETCEVGHFMPTVVFFGGNVADSVRMQSYEMVDAANALFVCGTSLATFSAYRLVKRAREQGKEVLIANYGETRGDNDATVKFEAPAEELLPPVVGSLEPRSSSIASFVS
ncbi:hypothetical protein IW140_004847 [Coemansia sp. RSA 1813]|nr:hypothetical protein EV178_004893 [Coemansia sp. RSA 1646]KAJ1769506.1 hypothetical protein LPJ74_003992 [Coemansia sp. RSA 1843]KAJ2087479.1 hypothetical protein IW138_004939 [Coemansia sp. RSA 986]KAJ2211702.1 hypothetical protein EV179_005259 [Coemansia sp. RSA 487]KAJ2566659.1 hypothetical protein IW140_004847 [Coemansia sp. RSA 1813]